MPAPPSSKVKVSGRVVYDSDYAIAFPVTQPPDQVFTVIKADPSSVIVECGRDYSRRIDLENVAERDAWFDACVSVFTATK